MVSKTISVTEDVYNLLKKMQLPHESFGDTIERLCKNFSTRNLLNWLETSNGWTDMSEKEIKDLEQVLADFKNGFRSQMSE